MTLRIGIDFDNTIVVYGNVFYNYAIKIFNMPKKISKNKASIRNYFWNYSGGKEDWIKLQGLVYGSKMLEASCAPGVKHFLTFCNNNNISVSIISHKTKYPKKGEKINLHNCAFDWMNTNGFFQSKEIGLNKKNIFFENLRKKKLERIYKQNCSIFIDDLPEIFTDPYFPKRILKVLYDPAEIHSINNDIISCSNWKQIENIILKNV